MGGTLIHSRELAVTHYVGLDGQPHFEISPVDGECTNLSRSSWEQLKAFAESHGMPRHAWPEFLDHALGIDVPLDEIHSRQAAFRLHLLSLPQEVVEQDEYAKLFVTWVKSSEIVFFCGA